MQLESLEVFCAVARHRSFSKAAQENKVTQSAASQVVSNLEERLGVQLIDRSTRPLQLTSLGQKYYEGCTVLLEQYVDLEASIRTAHAQLAGTVRIAAIYSVSLSDLGQLVQRYNVEQPDVKVHLEFLHPDRVYERVLTGAAEVVLEFDNLENIKKAVELGAGVAILPEPTLQREVVAQTLVARPLRD